MKKIFLTSYIGGANKVGDTRLPAPLMSDNGLVDRLRSAWTENAKLLFICASPDDHEKNDLVCECMKISFPMSGLSVSGIDVCDNRTEARAEHLNEYDAVFLSGGHVPTQNAFMRRIGLREKLASFPGLVIAYSAGSMNCADIVYSAPELDGEAIDPDFQRWIPGLGLTDINIYPHYGWLKDEMLDGMRVMEDITYPDSFRHEIIALMDGSYILIENGHETLYGEGFSIRDGVLRKICGHGESAMLK